MADNIQCLFWIFISMYWNIMKKLEKVEGSMTAYHEKLDGNISKNIEEVRNLPVSSLKTSRGTTVSKMTKFKLDDVAMDSEEGISEIEDIHRECIQEHLPLMSNDIILKRTYLLDELVQNECLTENEATDIREMDKRKDQIRKLAVTIGKRGRIKFSLFLEVLKRTDNFPHIAEKLESSYNTLANEKRKRKECIYCYIVRNVHLRDVIDILCSQKIVDLSFLDEVISCGDHDTDRLKSLWVRLIEIINSKKNGSSLEIFQESLKPKYEHISSKLSKDKKLLCICERKDFEKDEMIEKLSWPSGSCTTEERSTTSTTLRIKSQASAKSVISTISESHSDISNDEVNSKLPRTIQWLESIPQDKDVNYDEENMEAPIQFCDAVNEEQDFGAELPSKTITAPTLLDVSNDFLLKVAIEESRSAERCKNSVTPPPIYKTDDTVLQEAKHSFEKSQTTSTKSSKRKKKKRKKKHKSSDQPEDSTEKPSIQPAQEELSSVDSSEDRRTIGDRLFSNIPVENATNECPKKSCSNCTIEQPVSQGPVVLTESRHLDPLVKVGCCEKFKKCKK